MGGYTVVREGQAKELEPVRQLSNPSKARCGTATEPQRAHHAQQPALHNMHAAIPTPHGAYLQHHAVHDGLGHRLRHLLADLAHIPRHLQVNGRRQQQRGVVRHNLAVCTAAPKQARTCICAGTPAHQPQAPPG